MTNSTKDICLAWIVYSNCFINKIMGPHICHPQSARECLTSQAKQSGTPGTRKKVSLVQERVVFNQTKAWLSSETWPANAKPFWINRFIEGRGNGCLYRFSGEAEGERWGLDVSPFWKCIVDFVISCHLVCMKGNWAWMACLPPARQAVSLWKSVLVQIECTFL